MMAVGTVKWFNSIKGYGSFSQLMVVGKLSSTPVLLRKLACMSCVRDKGQSTKLPMTEAESNSRKNLRVIG